MSRFAKSCAPIDRFLFEGCDPVVCSVMRILFGFLLLVYTAIWMLDYELWFTDAGVLSSATAEAERLGLQFSLFFWLPSTPGIVQTSLVLLFVQSLLLMCGCWSRFQAACIFVWLVSFQHRNPQICDGEDTVFRLLAFMMIWMPLDYRWSLLRHCFDRPQSQATSQQAWALRLVQFEMTAIYASTAWSKLQGASWQDGTALYYVSQMQDVFGRGWLPDGMFEVEWFVKLATWSVLICEMVLPLALWLPPTRRWAIALGFALHVAIEYSMNLFLFEWVMMVGLLSFVTVRDAQSMLSRWKQWRKLTNGRRYVDSNH